MMVSTFRQTVSRPVRIKNGLNVYEVGINGVSAIRAESDSVDDVDGNLVPTMFWVVKDANNRTIAKYIHSQDSEVVFKEFSEPRIEMGWPTNIRPMISR